MHSLFSSAFLPGFVQDPCFQHGSDRPAYTQSQVEACYHSTLPLQSRILNLLHPQNSSLMHREDVSSDPELRIHKIKNIHFKVPQDQF
jgi:hypothetical protein